MLSKYFSEQLSDVTQSKTTEDILIVVQAIEGVLHSVEEIEKIYTASLPASSNELEVFHNDAAEEAGLFKETLAKGFDRASAQLLTKHHVLSAKADKLKEFFEKNVEKADISNPLFDTIGSLEDPEYLTRAKALLFLAVNYEENEKNAVRERIVRVPFKIDDFEPFGCKYINGFKAGCVSVLKEVIPLLQQEGHADLAQRTDNAISAISYNQQDAGLNSPQHYAEERIQAEQDSVAAVNLSLDPSGIRDIPYTAVNETWMEKIRLCGEYTHISSKDVSEIRTPQLKIT